MKLIDYSGINRLPCTVNNSPTYQLVGQTSDTIIAQAANAILGRLLFYVIISSVISPILQRPPIRIDERNLRLLTTAEKR